MSIFISLHFTGCASGNISPSNNQIEKTQLPINTAITQPPVNTPIVQDVESILSDKNYLKSCRSKFPKVHTQQVDFQGIYSGITTKDELIIQFGQPTKFSKTDQVEEYLYFDSSNSFWYGFYVTNKLVSDIYIGSDAKKLASLQNILEQYGCPDFIIAAQLSDDPFVVLSSEYNVTYLEYLTAGIWIRFERYPIKYSDTPSMIRFEIPHSFSSFLEVNRFLPIESSKVVDFSEAVVEE